MTKKLLQINPVVRTSTSTGKIMRALGEMAMATGWESYIAYSRGRDGVPQHTSRLVPVGNKLDVFLHGMASRLFDAHGLASRRATKHLIQRIRDIDPDVVHIHNVHGYFLNYPMLCAFLAERGKPVVWTAHDCWLFTGHCYHYAAAGCGRWQTGCHDCPQKQAFPRSWILDRSRRNWEAKRRAIAGIPSLMLVAVSEWMRSQLAQSFLKDRPCRVITNGIDLDTFQPRQAEVRSRYGITAPCFALAVASIWLPEKGFDDLLAFAAQLGADEQLVMVGQMSQDQRRRLPATIVPIARTSDARALAELYTAATAVINPTWQDNYPTVNLEAIACGTPVITYRTGGSVESVTEDTGFVVGQGDVAGLVKCFHAVRHAGKTRDSAACVDYARRHFNKEDRFRDYIKLYENLATR